MAITKNDIIEALKAMPALELSELVKELEQVFGVSAAMPIAMAAPAAGADVEEVEEKTSFDIVLEGYGDNKIAVIKAVREITTLGLKEAKETVESAPKTILENIDKAKAEELKSKLEAAGAAITLK